MGLAPEGNLEEQHKMKPFRIREIGLLLRQMLGALAYLVEFGMIHRDIKPTNILCDSRAHFRLADFGLAKEGDGLKTFKGTKPYMAPEMFANEPYTAAVDVWALGMVIAKLLAGTWPPGLKGNEGPSWCKAMVADFKRWTEFCLRIPAIPEEIRLNTLVQRYMLRVRPQDRESALDCLDRGDMLWRMLGQDSKEGRQKPTQEDSTSAFPNTPRGQKRKNLSSPKPSTESIDRIDHQQNNIVPMKRRGSPSGMSRRQKPSMVEPAVEEANDEAATNGPTPLPTAAIPAVNNAQGQTPDLALMMQAKKRYEDLFMAHLRLLVNSPD